MATPPLSAALDPNLCPVCQAVPPYGGDPLCLTCRARASAQLDWRLLLEAGLRLAVACGIEGLIGMLAGVLMFLPLSAASSSKYTLGDLQGMFAVSCVLFAPLIAGVYQLLLRVWVVSPWRWAAANTAGSLALGGLVLALSLGGLRLGALPDWQLSALVVPFEWGLGVGVALWQARLLVPPFQRREVWRRWSLIGWTGAAAVHMTVALAVPSSNDGFTLWLGTVSGFAAYGVVAHLVLTAFALDASLAARARRAQAPAELR